MKEFITRDPLLSRFVSKVFLFEDIPAADRKPDDIYLHEVEQCDIYLAILGKQYGWKGVDGKSPTELEFEQATRTHRERLVFVKGDDDKSREPEMAKLVNKAGRQVTRRRFSDTPGLIREVYASLIECLEGRGDFRSTPFDDSVCDGATLQDIDTAEVDAFVETAEAAGRLSLKGARTPKAVLQHFNLLRDGRPTNAAMLLFGKRPEVFFNNAQVHCFHFLGTEKRKPIASQQPYSGRLREVIDQAVEFVLGKIDRSVGTRAMGVQAPVKFEIPRPVITEAIVNAVAHRNYRHNGFVQVIVFADRIEVWNPGELPPGLTPALLREPHGPIPRNPLIAEPLFRVKYVEKAGTGTTDMIADCREAGLPEPDFGQRGPHFVVTIWRDWLTEDVIGSLGLNDRQQRVLIHLKVRGRIGNTEYQTLVGVSKRTAHRDLIELVEKGIVEKVGTTGKGTVYILRKGAQKGPEGPTESKDVKGATKGSKGS
ncbi:MAG: ATP-binding protein [Thermodesulfobacteriota bacterium]